MKDEPDGSRSEAVRDALERTLALQERRRIDAAMLEGYRRMSPEPTSPEERACAIAAIEEEPW